MSTRSEKFGPKDEQMALFVAKGYSLLKAGEKVGYSRATCYRRGADPNFRSLVLQYRAAMIDQALGGLSTIAVAAVKKLQELLKSANENVALKSAQAILDTLIKYRENVELAERVEALERNLREREHQESTDAA